MHTTRFLPWTLFGAMSGQAFATAVTLDNRSGRRLCVADAGTHQEANGPESQIAGIDGVDAGQELEPFDSARFIPSST